MHEVLAQLLMEDMLYPQPTESDRHKGGTQKGRNHGQMNPGAVSIMQFHFSVVIGSQLADQQAAARMSPVGTKHASESVYECLLSGVKRIKRALAITRFSRLNSEMRYVMEKVPGRDMWAVIDSVTLRPALVNDVPQIDLELDDADDLTDLLNRLYREASVSAKH